MQELSEVLSQLRDIHEPAPISWWPPSIGWWLSGLLLILTVAGFLYLWKLRRSALKRLAKIEFQAIIRNFNIHHDKQRLIKDLSVFLRRVALKNHSQEVAGKTGENWINFLDGMSGEPLLERHHGELLINGPYQSHIEYDEKRVLSDIEKWVRKLK